MAAGPALLGIGFVTPKDGPSWFDASIITEVGGVLTYTLLPEGYGAVHFPVVETGADSILFASAPGDLVQRFRYRRSGDTLWLETESARDGERRLSWQRADLAPALVLEEADRGFAADSAARGADAWAAVFAEDGKLWRRGQPEDWGPDAIRESMQRAFADPDTLLAWEPHTSALAPAGDMGFTIGCYEILRRRPGAPQTREDAGTYLTVWRREADGSWKAVFDTVVPGAVPAGR